MSKTFLTYASAIAIGIIAAGFFVTAAVFAQTANDIPPELQEVAAGLRGAGFTCDSKETCAAACDAHFDQCLALSEEHGVYTADEKGLAQSFRQEVLAKLATASDKEFAERVVQLANDLLRTKPTLARQLNINRERVTAAETIVNEVKKAGITVDRCSQPANTLAHDELEKCLSAVKGLSARADTVKEYLSEDRLAKGVEGEQSLALQNALSRGEVQCGDNTPDGCGNFCLNPSAEARTAGNAVIPAVCREIAQRYFGPSGVRALEDAYARVQRTGDFYREGATKFVLALPDGRRIVGHDAIRDECNRAFSARDLSTAEACGDFAAKSGLATRTDVEEGLAFLRSFEGDVPLDECIRNPQRCQEFISDEHREEFTATREIETVMTRALGFSPQECAKPERAEACFAAARQAIPELERLAESGSREARRMVEEFKKNLLRNDVATRAVQEEAGPGGCRSTTQCREFCSKSENGPECLAFAAKKGVFNVREVSERFVTYRDRLGQQGTTGQPAAEIIGVSRPGAEHADVAQPPAVSPECLAAVQRGDFERARSLCEAATCPAYYPAPCRNPIDEFRPFARDARGCAVPAPECVLIVRETPRTPVCPAIATVDSCPAGQERYVTFQSQECGIFYACRTAQSCQNGYYRDAAGACVPTGGQQCPEGQYWNGNACVAGICESYATHTTCNASGHGCTWNGTRCIAGSGPGGGSCYNQPLSQCNSPCVVYNDQHGNHCDDAAHGQAAGGSCGSHQTQAECNQYGSYCSWNGNACVQNTSGGTPQCSDGQDNDSDGTTDYPADTSCYDQNDNDEWYPPSGGTGTTPQCSDGIDNDGDGKIDFGTGANNDTGCSNALDWTETPDGGSGAGIPAAPTGLAAAAASGGGAQITWPGPSGSNITAYQVWWSPPGTSFTLRTTINVGSSFTSVSHTETNLGTGTYGFRVRACNASGCSGDSNTATFSGSGTASAGTSSDELCSANWSGSFSIEDGSGNCFRSTSSGMQYSSANGLGPPNPCTGANTPVYGCSSGGGSGATSCPANIASLLAGCHNMGPAYFNGNMTAYVFPNTTTVIECTASYIASCTVGAPGSGTASCASYLASSACVANASCNWNTAQAVCQPNSGGTSGSSCSTNTSQSSCTAVSGCAWANNVCYASGSGTGTGVTSCSQYGSGWHTIDSSGNCFDSSMYNYRTPGGGGPYACTGYNSPVGGCSSPTGGGSTGSCATNVTQSSCTVTAGCAWSAVSNSCYASGSGSTGCTQYGVGWHVMSDPSICFDPEMHNYRTTNGTLYSCAATPVAGCAGSSTGSGTSCPSGQTWYVPPSGGTGYCQTSSGSTSGCSTPANCFDSAICASSGWYWYNSGCWSSPQSGSGSGSSGPICGNSACESGETAASCPADCGSTSSCSTPSNCYVQSTCTSSGWYWYNSGCWNSPQSSGGSTTGTGTGSCPSGQYWNGSSCVSSSGSGCSGIIQQSACVSPCIWSGSSCGSGGAFVPYCPSNHFWNGSHCVVGVNPRIAHALAVPAERTLASTHVSLRDFFAHILRALLE